MPKDGLTSVGLRIFHARKGLRKLSQAKLAEAVGVKQSSISDLESGATKEISGPVLIGIAKALQVRPEWIMTGAGQIEPSAEEALSDDERELVKLYRGASSRWKIAIKYMAGMRNEAKQEEAGAYVLSKIFATPVPDSKLGDNWTRPDKDKP